MSREAGAHVCVVLCVEHLVLSVEIIQKKDNKYRDSKVLRIKLKNETVSLLTRYHCRIFLDVQRVWT